jgi:hypothetical protein
LAASAVGGGATMPSSQSMQLRVSFSIRVFRWVERTGNAGSNRLRSMFQPNAYIVDQSDSANLPMVNANDTIQRENDDGFIAKVDAAGNSLLYSSFIGEEQNDIVTAIAVDKDPEKKRTLPDE